MNRSLGMHTLSAVAGAVHVLVLHCSCTCSKAGCTMVCSAVCNVTGTGADSLSMSCMYGAVHHGWMSHGAAAQLQEEDDDIRSGSQLAVNVRFNRGTKVCSPNLAGAPRRGAQIRRHLPKVEIRGGTCTARVTVTDNCNCDCAER